MGQFFRNIHYIILYLCWWLYFDTHHTNQTFLDVRKSIETWFQGPVFSFKSLSNRSHSTIKNTIVLSYSTNDDFPKKFNFNFPQSYSYQRPIFGIDHISNKDFSDSPSSFYHLFYVTTLFKYPNMCNKHSRITIKTRGPYTQKNHQRLLIFCMNIHQLPYFPILVPIYSILIVDQDDNTPKTTLFNFWLLFNESYINPP